jgi:hypothetical protein
MACKAYTETLFSEGDEAPIKSCSYSLPDGHTMAARESVIKLWRDDANE